MLSVCCSYFANGHFDRRRISSPAEVVDCMVCLAKTPCKLLAASGELNYNGHHSTTSLSTRTLNTDLLSYLLTSLVKRSRQSLQVKVAFLVLFIMLLIKGNLLPSLLTYCRRPPPLLASGYVFTAVYLFRLSVCYQDNCKNYSFIQHLIRTRQHSYKL